MCNKEKLRVWPAVVRKEILHLLKRLTVKTYGDFSLRIPGEIVKIFGEILEATCWAMLEIMDRANGVGLAAQQIGLRERICVIDTLNQWSSQTLAELDGKNLLCTEMDITPFPLFLINAKVIDRSKELLEQGEGCLSIPGVYARTKRPQWVAVSYQDQHGFFHEIRADGLLGQCLQHEIDHNNGVLFTDESRVHPGDLPTVQIALEKFSHQHPVNC
ncbi:MAG: peptide deformylase [Puniceicoccales bacterium]|jgi:peptide deformylase|nr:peptide deformylase [Puniceicoccales bacterium]